MYGTICGGGSDVSKCRLRGADGCEHGESVVGGYGVAIWGGVIGREEGGRVCIC